MQRSVAQCAEQTPRCTTRSVARCAEQTTRSTILGSEPKQPLSSENYYPKPEGRVEALKQPNAPSLFAVLQKIQKIQSPSQLKIDGSGKKRSYGLTRVVYPDPRSRSENRGLERHGEPCVGDSMERGGVTALQGSLTQTRHLEPEGVWNDMRSAARKEAELRPSAGRLPRSPNFGTRSESGTTWADLHGTTALRGSFTRIRHLGEKRGLERHEERRVVNEMGRSGATALRGLITSQIPDVEARSRVWNDFGG